jgi:ADP-heptose:LPS heptosyltransferase
VNAVFSLRQHALHRRYDTVFLSHSFGEAKVAMPGARMIRSRDWELFHPGHAHHEAVFNLEAAKQLLGVDYGPGDALKCFVGGLTYQWPAGDLVGFHGGSKDGFWTSKRWPFFSELAGWLKQGGYRVASFGTPDEYVEGTEDMTGGSIHEMAERMRICSYFVSNDSGVMNLANALGIPLIGLFGPTNARTRGPLGRTSRSVSLTKPCAPCECSNHKFFLTGGCRCIGEISLRDVIAAFEAIVRDLTSGSAGRPSGRRDLGATAA